MRPLSFQKGGGGLGGLGGGRFGYDMMRLTGPGRVRGSPATARPKRAGITKPHYTRHGGVNPMATDAQIEAAVNAMRAIRTRGGKVHDDVLRAYARTALKAAELAQIAEFQSLQKRAELLAEQARQAAGGRRT